MEIASGRSGDPVPPRIFSGEENTMEKALSEYQVYVAEHYTSKNS
jgi:hypothetical protein